MQLRDFARIGIITAIFALIGVAPSFADSDDQRDMRQDQHAIQQEHKDIHKDQEAEHRALRHGDERGAATIDRDMQKDRQQLRDDQRDLHQDRRESDHD